MLASRAVAPLAIGAAGRFRLVSVEDCVCASARRCGDSRGIPYRSAPAESGKSVERGKRRLTRCVDHLGRVPYRRPLLAFSAAPLVPSGGSRRGLPNSLAKPCFVPPIDSRRQAAGSTRSQSGPQLASQKPPCTLLTRSLIARPDHQSAEEQSG